MESFADTDLDALAITLVAGAMGRTIATAESLTGGLVGATITSVPGASRVYRGGVVAYATDLKDTLLGVSPDLLAHGGPVQLEVAIQMAKGVAQRLDAEFGLAITGVAGPDPQSGHLPGTVFLACWQRESEFGPEQLQTDKLQLNPLIEDLSDRRAAIREESTAAALELLLSML